MKHIVGYSVVLMGLLILVAFVVGIVATRFAGPCAQETRSSIDYAAISDRLKRETVANSMGA